MKERIFKKYIELSNRLGTSNVTLSKLAKELDMSKANLYTYFPDKETIIIEMIEYNVENFLKNINESDIIIHDPADKLKSFIQTHVRIALEQEVFLNIIHDIIHNKLITNKDKLYNMKKFEKSLKDILVKILSEGKSRRMFLDSLDEERTSSYILSLLRGVFFENHFFGEEKRIFNIEYSKKYGEEIFSLIFKGIKK